jgi:hypothetical protein
MQKKSFDMTHDYLIFGKNQNLLYKFFMKYITQIVFIQSKLINAQLEENVSYQ